MTSTAFPCFDCRSVGSYTIHPEQDGDGPPYETKCLTCRGYGFAIAEAVRAFFGLAGVVPVGSVIAVHGQSVKSVGCGSLLVQSGARQFCVVIEDWSQAEQRYVPVTDRDEFRFTPRLRDEAERASVLEILANSVRLFVSHERQRQPATKEAPQGPERLVCGGCGSCEYCCYGQA